MSRESKGRNRHREHREREQRTGGDPEEHTERTGNPKKPTEHKGGDPEKCSDTPYLQYIKADHFGAWYNKTIGPFERHLNVVFGRNEAGKTTLASFVDGVLFGWESARGGRNNYKPKDAERAGSLIFADGENEGAGFEVRRETNKQGLQGDASIIADTDRDTYRTMFSLNSDELLSLESAGDVTSRLLTAGSGTAVSPTSVRQQIESQIKEFTSRAEEADHSLVRLEKEEEAVRAQKTAAQEEAMQYRDDEQEFRELDPTRQELTEQEHSLSEKIGSLRLCRSKLENIKKDIACAEEDIKNARREEAEAKEKRLACEKEYEGSFASVSDTEERSMRSRVDDLASRKSAQKGLTDAARESSKEAHAQYEALRETLGVAPKGDGTRSEASHRQTVKVLQIVALTVICIVLLVFGILLFAGGNEASSLSYMALGGVLIAVAVALAVVVLVLFMRSNKESAINNEQLGRANQVAVREKKKLEACEEDTQKLEQEIADELEKMGLGEAGSSPNLARDLLDEAKRLRTEIEQNRQREQNAADDAQRAISRKDELVQQEICLREEAGLSSDETLDDIDREIERLETQHRDVRDELTGVERRWGELNEELKQAKLKDDLDRIKNKEQDIKTRKTEAMRDLVRLLLAQHMLEQAINLWGIESQPEVYTQAGRLLELMTDGRWCRIELLDNDNFQVSDEAHNVCPAGKLSTGTSQQLYLALRIALLMCADNVGQSIPVIADDILVNFDASRRRGAARALTELAQMRQVIVLTCHEEVVSVLQEADESANVIEL